MVGIAVPFPLETRFAGVLRKVVHVPKVIIRQGIQHLVPCNVMEKVLGTWRPFLILIQGI